MVATLDGRLSLCAQCKMRQQVLLAWYSGVCWVQETNKIGIKKITTSLLQLYFQQMPMFHFLKIIKFAGNLSAFLTPSSARKTNKQATITIELSSYVQTKYGGIENQQTMSQKWLHGSFPVQTYISYQKLYFEITVPAERHMKQSNYISNDNIVCYTFNEFKDRKV